MVGIAVDRILAGFPSSAGAVLEGLVFWGFLRGHLPLARLREGARRIGTDPDAAPAARALLEQTAISFVHFVIGPIFWFLLTGLPGVFAAAAAWAVDRAAEGGRAHPFAAVPRRLEDVAIWLPGRIAELVLAIAAASVPRGRPIAALRQGWSNAQLGQYGAIAALSGGLDLALPGSGIGGRPDGGRMHPGRNDVLRATWLYVVALLLVTGILVLLAIVEQPMR